ncbi:MAG: hypothetical protein WC774_03120 [Candidatus Gracilibacteria bacterium]
MENQSLVIGDQLPTTEMRPGTGAVFMDEKGFASGGDVGIPPTSVVWQKRFSQMAYDAVMKFQPNVPGNLGK